MSSRTNASIGMAAKWNSSLGILLRIVSFLACRTTSPVPCWLSVRLTLSPTW
jgi:hypothetical protein